MHSSYFENRKWSDERINNARWILETECGWKTRIAEEHLDMKQATDLVAIGDWGIKKHIAVRSRSYAGYYKRFGKEFTIRSRIPSGINTELLKICTGFADYMFYGFSEGLVHRYFYIIDLMVFRVATTIGHDAFSVEKPNKYDGTFFRAYDIRKLSYFPIIFKEGGY